MLAQHKGEGLFKTRFRGFDRNQFKVKSPLSSTNSSSISTFDGEDTSSINGNNAGELILFTFYLYLQFKENYASYSDLISIKETLINAQEKPLYQL